MKRFRIAVCLACAIFLPGSPLASQEAAEPASAQPARPEALGLEAVLGSAEENAPGLIEARENLESARLSLLAVQPLGDSSLSLSGGASFGQQDSWNASLGLNLPILTGLSATGRLQWKESLSGSAGLSWAPFASTQKATDAALSWRLAGLSLQEAVIDARRAAYAAAAAWLRADAARTSAVEGAAIGKIGLSAVQARFDRGEASPVELLEARGEQSKLEQAAYKAERALSDAREALADAAGGSVADLIRSGAALSLAEGAPAAGADDAAAWSAPDYGSIPVKGTVLKAEAALAAAKAGLLSSGQGPLSLQASVDSSLVFSVNGSLDLDAALLFGRDSAQRDIGIAKAERALQAARDAARDDYDKAVREVRDAEYSLVVARMDLESAGVAAARAGLLQKADAISELDYRKSIQGLRDAEAGRAAAALELERAKAWFER